MYKIWNKDIEETLKGNYIKAFQLIEEENAAYKKRVMDKIQEKEKRRWEK